MSRYSFRHWWEVVRIEGEDDEWTWWIESEIEPPVGPHNAKSFLGASLAAKAAMEDKATPALQSSRLQSKFLVQEDDAPRFYQKDIELLDFGMWYEDEEVKFPHGFWNLVFELEESGEFRGEAIRKAMVVFEIE